MGVSISGSGNVSATAITTQGGTGIFPAPSFAWSSVVTSNTNASSNYGYAVNTAAAAITVTLP